MRSLSRRAVLGAGLSAGMVAAGHRPALAADWPRRPVRVLIGYGPGGAGDVATRLVSAKMSSQFGQPFVIENRPSAGGLVASQLLMQAPRDGYTLMMAGPGNVSMAPGMFRKVPFDAADPLKDLAPIALTCHFGCVIAVRGDSPMRTLGDLIALGKKTPSPLNFATTSAGTAPNVGIDMLKIKAGVDGGHVAFRTTGEAIVAVESGQAQVVMDATTSMMPMFQSGSLRPLAVTASERDPQLPAVPTALEQGISDYIVTAWNGLVAPVGTPLPVIGVLNAAMNDALKQPDLVKQFDTLGVTRDGGTPEAFGDFMRKDFARWSEAIRAAHIEPQ